MRRRSWIALVAAASLASIPTAVLAGPPEDSCANFRTVAFTHDVQASFRTLGTHAYEILLTWVDEDGAPQEDLTQHEVTIAASAPTFVGNVLLRPVSVWGLQEDGTVQRRVTTIDDGQAARFFSQVPFGAGDPIGPTSTQSLRWETTPGTFSAWVTMAKGPSVVGCSPGQDGLFHRSY